MRPGQYVQYVEEWITILTEGERIEGQLFHASGTRLSDFLNSSIQQESKFLKVKNPTVYCRHSGAELNKAPFLMVAIDRVVMVMTHSPDHGDGNDPAELSSGRIGGEASSRFL